MLARNVLWGSMAHTGTYSDENKEVILLFVKLKYPYSIFLVSGYIMSCFALENCILDFVFAPLKPLAK